MSSEETPKSLNRTVLVVEDVFMVRRTLELMLKSGGYDVLEAKSSQEAMDLLKEESSRVDLIFLDVMMPGMDGLKFCKVLKSLGPTRDIPLILCTARTDLATVVEVKEIGVTDFIAKPFTRDVVLNRADQVLGVDRTGPGKPEENMDGGEES